MTERLTRQAVAARLGLALGSLRSTIVRAEGTANPFPAPTYVGRTPTWTAQQIDEWVAQRPGRGRRS